jgi:predicted ATPase
VLSGEPGIGKTRLCAEIAERAMAAGCRVLSGHCQEISAEIPYLPFVEVIEAALGDSATRGSDLLAGGNADLSPLFPELPRQPFDAAASNAALAPAEQRRQLFRAFTGFLHRLAAERPLVLVIEDLHWADPSTLLLLGHVARQLAGAPISVIATHRDAPAEVGSELRRLLEELVRLRIARSIALRPLAVSAVEAMVGNLAAQEPPPQLVIEMYRETGGNPFFVEEMFEYLGEEAKLFDGAGRLRERIDIREADVPRSIQLIIGRRIERPILTGRVGHFYSARSKPVM